jgi:hypothetical protein
MRALFGLGITLVAVTPVAWAQNNQPASLAPVPLAPGIISAPNAPLPAPSAPQSLPPPDLPAPDLPTDSTAAPPNDPTALAEPPVASPQSPDHTTNTPAQIKPIWDRRGSAVLDVLDKEDGAVHRIDVPVGSSVVEGKLSVAVASCVERPKGMTPDAATFATVTSKTGTTNASSTVDAPLFRGWLIRSEPGATVVGDAAVTFRLIGCGGG